MILAQYVILRSFLRRPIPEPERAGMVRHFAHTRQPDGGWGLHAEAPSYVFVTTLAYVALRLLGLPADHAAHGRRAAMAARAAERRARQSPLGANSGSRWPAFTTTRA